MTEFSSPIRIAAGAGSPEQRIAVIRQMDWDDLAAAASQCRACDLYQGTRHAVFGEGDRQADWLIVGEAPGATEDRTGRPFAGQSGRLLDEMLEAIGLARTTNVYIGNVVKHRPPENRNPTGSEVVACLPYLERQIELLQPRIILALGKVAAHSLLQGSETMAQLRGVAHDYQNIPLVVTYHPAYLLRRPPEKAKAWEDLRFARNLYETRQRARPTSVTSSGPL